MLQTNQKIVFISYYYCPPHFGGELLIATERLKSLSQRGKEIIVFTSGVPGQKNKEIVGGIKIYRSPIVGTGRISRRINRMLFWLWIFPRLLFEKDVKVVHIESFLSILGYISPFFYANLLVYMAHFKKAKTICVHSLASNEHDYFQIHNKWEAKYFHNIDTIICVSDALYDSVKEYYPQKAKLELCGIQEEIFIPIDHEERQNIRHENHISDDDVVFSFIGSFEKRKGLDLIIASFIKYQSNINWKLWLIGPYRKEESQHIHEDEVNELLSPLISLNDRVNYWGRITDRKYLARILSSSDIFLFPTRREGFGIAPLEAMSCGIPVILSRIPGITDLANIDNQTGIYITPGSQLELENAMKKLAIDQELRQQMGLNGRKRIIENFSWNRHVDHWEKIYFDN